MKVLQKGFTQIFTQRHLKASHKKQDPTLWNHFRNEKFDFLTLVPWLSQTCLVLCTLGDLVEPQASHYLHHQILFYKYWIKIKGNWLESWGPARGGPMSPVWILKCLVSVFIKACRLLLALPSLSQFGQGRLSLVAISFYALLLLFGPCRLSEFTLAGLQSCLKSL